MYRRGDEPTGSPSGAAPVKEHEGLALLVFSRKIHDANLIDSIPLDRYVG